MLSSFLLFGLCVFTNAEKFIREFYFVEESLNWTEARQYCRAHYTDLASITNRDHKYKLYRPEYYDGDAWIGLHVYQNLRPNYQSTLDKCLEVYPDGSWKLYSCNYTQSFICYDSVKKTFIPVRISLSWTEAQAYCRDNHTELAVIQNEAENQKVVSLLQNNQIPYAWIGQLSTTWSWSDYSPLNFKNWQSGHPLGSKNVTCAVEGVDHYWKDVSCDLRLPFFCYRAKKRNLVMRVVIGSTQD